MPPAIETTLARHLGPVLLGIKPAAAFPRPECWPHCVALLARHRLKVRLLPKAGKPSLALVYRPAPLAAALADPDARSALSALGYPTAGGLGGQLGFLARRFSEAADFPHEIGFFLGYPPEDVLGFIRHKGMGCKLCGAWKVYGDAQKAAALFAQYEHCRQTLLEYLKAGGSLWESGLPSLAAS